jgi:hypothetical protein
MSGDLTSGEAMSFNVKIFVRHDNNVRKTEVLHSEDFPSLSKAQKFCKSWMRGYKYKLCNYFFHLTCDESDVWMTVSSGDFVVISEPTVVDSVYRQKDDELSEIEEKIDLLAAECSKIEKENADLYTETEKIRAQNQDLSRKIENERPRSGFLDYMSALNSQRTHVTYEVGLDDVGHDYHSRAEQWANQAIGGLRGRRG